MKHLQFFFFFLPKNSYTDRSQGVPLLKMRQYQELISYKVRYSTVDQPY